MSSTNDTTLDPVLNRYINDVPQFDRFCGVDELAHEANVLARRHPEVATRVRVGTSRLGDPIHALRIGDTSPNALVFGGVHPNEPIGGLTAIHLARVLCEDSALRARLGLSWTVIPCIDPDGTRLNEGWFAGPFTRSHYGRNFYRPPGDEQVEWTFPFAYKRAFFDRVLPETLCLMRLIDADKPALMCSLHNGELGGVYYYLSRPLPAVYGALQEIPRTLGLPLDLGEPEVPFVERFQGPIYGMIRSEDSYDFAEQAGVDPTASLGGASSAAYAEKYGTLTLVSELPYWVDARAQDQTPVDRTYAELLLERAEQIGALCDSMGESLDEVGPDLTADSPFLRATRKFLPTLREIPQQDRYRAAQQDSARPATTAEEHSLADLVHCFRLRYAGMLLRALHGEIAIGNATPRIRARVSELQSTYAQWCRVADAATPANHVPIRSLVANQFGAILATAMELHR